MSATTSTSIASSMVVAYMMEGPITPTWKLVDVTANPGSPLLDLSRAKTHDITVTFSKPDDPAAEEAARLHNAALIGQAVAAALRRNGR